MIKSLQLSTGELYVINQTRHATFGWMPTKIADSEDLTGYYIHDKDGVRAFINKNYVVCVVYDNDAKATV